MDPTNPAQAIFRRQQEAKVLMAPQVSLWRDLATYVKPDRDVIGVNGAGSSPNSAAFDLFDGTAMHGNLIYASGCMSYLTPADSPWFRFDAPQRLNDDDQVKAWLAEVTEITQMRLADSNFYSEIHQCWLEDGAFGTPSIFCESGTESPIEFTAREVGDYQILENSRGRIDTWFHEFTLSARQAAQKFGEPGDQLPQHILDALKEGGTKADAKHQFLHVIYPRADAERDHLKLDGPNMPIASVYLSVTDKTIVRTSGYWETPEASSRYQKWGKNPWGIAPALYALADQRQLNDLQMNMDVLAEVAAFPRILAHADLEGEIDLRRSGVTFFGDQTKKAEEWLTGGRYDVGVDRVRERQEAVKRAFHVDLFQMFASLPAGKEMTATETLERMREKLTLFSPTFARKTIEMLNPCLKRVFGLLLRAGEYPEIPEALMSMPVPGQLQIADPQITYTSRIAMAIKLIQGAGLQRSVQSFAPMIEMGLPVLDNLNLDRAFRDTLRNEGVNEDWMIGEQEVGQMREQRAQAQAEAAQKEEMMQGAEAAAKLQKAGLMDQ